MEIQVRKIKRAIAKNERRLKAGKPVRVGDEYWDSRIERLTARLEMILFLRGQA